MGTGRFNLVQGAIGMGVGIGASSRHSQGGDGSIYFGWRGSTDPRNPLILAHGKTLF
jgi:hypothetical protein